MKRLTKYIVSFISNIDLDLTKSYHLQRLVMPFLHFRWVRVPCKRVRMEFSLEDRKIPVYCYYPEKEDVNSLILFFHGGGFVAGSRISYDKLCVKMAKELEKIVVFVDYHLAPEYPYPKGLEDCYYVAKAIYLDGFLKVKSENVTLMGDSAGGNLSAVISLKAKEEGLFFPKRQILIYPVLYHDHSKNTKFLSVKEKGDNYLLKAKYLEDYFTLYTKDENRKSPYVAPLLANNFKNQPKTLIITAELDPLVDEAKEFARCLEQDGNEVEYHQINGCIHGFFNGNLHTREVRKAFDYIKEFLNKE